MQSAAGPAVSRRAFRGSCTEYPVLCQHWSRASGRSSRTTWTLGKWDPTAFTGLSHRQEEGSRSKTNEMTCPSQVQVLLACGFESLLQTQHFLLSGASAGPRRP